MNERRVEYLVGLRRVCVVITRLVGAVMVLEWLVLLGVFLYFVFFFFLSRKFEVKLSVQWTREIVRWYSGFRGYFP